MHKPKVYLRESYGELILEDKNKMVAEGRVMEGKNPKKEAMTLKVLGETMGYQVVDETGLLKKKKRKWICTKNGQKD